jgi:proline iminopeptidase
MIPEDLRFSYIDPLEKNYHVIFYFQRGSGCSKETLDENTMEWPVFVEDLEAIRKALQLDKVTLLGHCWGSSLAIKYALAYPDNLAKLILVDPMPITESSKNVFCKIEKRQNATKERKNAKYWEDFRKK